MELFDVRQLPPIGDSGRKTGVLWRMIFISESHMLFQLRRDRSTYLDYINHENDRQLLERLGLILADGRRYVTQWWPTAYALRDLHKPQEEPREFPNLETLLSHWDAHEHESLHLSRKMVIRVDPMQAEVGEYAYIQNYGYHSRSLSTILLEGRCFDRKTGQRLADDYRGAHTFAQAVAFVDMIENKELETDDNAD